MAGAAKPAGNGVSGVVAAAVQDARDAVAADREAVEQLDFLAPAGGQVLSLEAAQEDAEARRKRGRPAGSANRSTVELRRWLLAGGIVPQKWMADWLLISPEELGKRLGCSTAQAFDRQTRLAIELAPYLVPKMAPVGDDGKAAPMLVINMGGSGAAQAGGLAPWEEEYGVLENQSLTDDRVAKSHATDDVVEENH